MVEIIATEICRVLEIIDGKSYFPSPEPLGIPLKH
jgi:hypothetical protein